MKWPRSGLQVHECIEGILKLVRHPTYRGPINIGSDEMVTINELVAKIVQISGKKITIK